jgi:hypothetical protein
MQLWSELFDAQMLRLQEHKVHDIAMAMLMGLHDPLFEKLKSFEFESGLEYIPFIPVIPVGYRSVYDQLAMIRPGSWSRLEVYEIENKRVISFSPYFMVGIHVSDTSIGTAATRAYLAQKKYSPMALVEALALYLHSGPYEKEIYIPDSYYKYASGTGIHLCTTEVNAIKLGVELDWHYESAIPADFKYPLFGSTIGWE